MTQPEAPRLPPIAHLNALPLDQFVAAVEPLFEAAPPLANGLYADRPYESYAALLNHAAIVIAGLNEADTIAVINAHPRIGENANAVRAQSALSYREQGYDREAALQQADLDQVYRTLAELNRAYEDRFGFRFVVFVNRRPKSAIIDVLRERLHNAREHEMATAINDMLAIARDRLATLQANAA